MGPKILESLARVVGMKKTIALATASIFAVVGLAACSSEPAEEPVEEEVVTEELPDGEEEEVEEEEVVEEDGDEEEEK